MAELLDPELLQAIDALTGQSFKGEIWRITWSARDPFPGNTGSGRWSPEGRFEALYTSLDSNGALAEVYHHLSLAPVMSSSHMRLNHIQVSLENVLCLSATQFKKLGIEVAIGMRPDYKRSQTIGQAAYMLDYQGIIVPSTRWDCNNLLLFLDRVDLNKQLKLLEASDVNWPAWKEQVKDGDNKRRPRRVPT